MWTKMSQGNKNMTARKILAMSKKTLVRIVSLIQPLLFQEIPATSYKILVRTGSGTRDRGKMFHSQQSQGIFHSQKLQQFLSRLARIRSRRFLLMCSEGIFLFFQVIYCQPTNLITKIMLT